MIGTSGYLKNLQSGGMPTDWATARPLSEDNYDLSDAVVVGSRPHDPIFDFSDPVSGFEWLDQTANNAARALRRATSLPSVTGDSDRFWQNVCVRDGQFVAGYDWDSLIFGPESCIVGWVAGAFTQGSPKPPDSSLPHRGRRFYLRLRDCLQSELWLGGADDGRGGLELGPLTTPDVSLEQQLLCHGPTRRVVYPPTRK